MVENSVLSSVCYTFTIPYPQYLIGPPAKITYQPYITLVTDGGREIIKLVSMVNDGVPVKYILPGMITSTDDTTLSVFKGVTRN